MRVVRVDINGFRGVESASLPSCGELNVLIGKNNSGKSTILDAIDGFFGVVSSGSLVARGDGIVGRDIDFHRGDGEPGPIRIAVDFALSQLELDEIVADVVAEAPQMKNALDAVAATERLRVEVTAVRGSSRQSPFAYISNVALVDEDASSPSGKLSRVLLSLSSSAAIEMLDRIEKVSRAERQAFEVLEFGRRIDADDFQVLRRETTDRGVVNATRLGRRMMAANPEITYEVENLIRHAENYGDFRRQLDAVASSVRTSAQRAGKEPLTHAVGTFSGDALTVPDYANSILARVGAITLLHLRDRRDPVGREEAQRLLSLKTRRKGPEVLKNIQETVHSLLGVSIDAFESERPSSAPGEARAEMDVDEVLVEMNGAGIREALRLILDNELGAPLLLLVEEPEVHLHPALELSMLRYLKAASSRAQIFITTHSTNFLDTPEMRNVYLTRRDPWVSASLLDHEQAETAIPDELGLRLSSLFMYDRLVFVEGASDEAILRELAPLVGVNFGQSNVGFVVMGSARNFTHYASTATIDLLTKRRVKMSFILDRDEATEEEVAALTHRLNGVAEIHVLQKREIENYLANARALMHFIREKARLQNVELDDISTESVNAHLQECADGLQRLAVEKRVARSVCAPVFLDRHSVLSETGNDEFSARLAAEIERQLEGLRARLAGIASLTAQEEERVARVWKSGKMDIVPGDELLDAVCQKYGVRFKKRRDGARLAGLLSPNEVPLELVQLLRSLVA